jgi:iron-sulfur cluster assembly accessory protein
METNLHTETESVIPSTDQPVILTAKAVEMVKKALAEENLTNHGLRIAVHGGGCSGLQYALDFADEARPGDTIYEVDGVKLFIDLASLTYLKGTTVDYVSGLNGQGFKFSNPNAKRSCGCGSSFS